MRLSGILALAGLQLIDAASTPGAKPNEFCLVIDTPYLPVTGQAVHIGQSIDAVYLAKIGSTTKGNLGKFNIMGGTLNRTNQVGYMNVMEPNNNIEAKVYAFAIVGMAWTGSFPLSCSLDPNTLALGCTASNKPKIVWKNFGLNGTENYVTINTGAPAKPITLTA